MLTKGDQVLAGVDVKTFADFLTADSPGKFFHARIKGCYDCAKV